MPQPLHGFCGQIPVTGWPSVPIGQGTSRAVDWHSPGREKPNTTSAGSRAVGDFRRNGRLSSTLHGSCSQIPATGWPSVPIGQGTSRAIDWHTLGRKKPNTTSAGSRAVGEFYSNGLLSTPRHGSCGQIPATGWPSVPIGQGTSRAIDWHSLGSAKPKTTSAGSRAVGDFRRNGRLSPPLHRFCCKISANG